MEFIGIGPMELLVILVLALIVVGPNRLPELAAQLGRFMRAFRRYTSQVTKDFNETMQDLEKEYDQMKGEWKDVGQGLDDAAKVANEELDASRKALNEAADSPKTPSTSQ